MNFYQSSAARQLIVNKIKGSPLIKSLLEVSGIA
jgi:hypothetical protein